MKEITLPMTGRQYRCQRPPNTPTDMGGWEVLTYLGWKRVINRVICEALNVESKYKILDEKGLRINPLKRKP